MRALIVTLSLGVLLASCGNDSQQAGDAPSDSNASKTVLNRDSLRKSYLAFREAQADSIPTYQVKEEGKLYP